MKKNVGKTDKIIRLLLGLVFAILAVFIASGALQILLGVLSFIMIFTALSNFCFLYKIIGVNTCKIEKND